MSPLTHLAPTFPADINLTALYDALIIVSNGRELPRHWFVQIDGGEWDRFFMAFFGWLMQMGIVEEVFVSKLPVGHTHIDIDQKFAVISIHINGSKKRNIMGHAHHTPSHFVKLLQAAFERMNKDADTPTKVICKSWWVVGGCRVLAIAS
jgi:hypothetical protein